MGDTPSPFTTNTMSDYRATINWRHDGPGSFLKRQYTREHSWHFDGGITVPASSAPSSVPAPWSNADNVDPEEAFVASIASCHMLTYLYVASGAGFAVRSYQDDAVGRMTADPKGRLWVSHIALSPKIEYADGAAPSAEREAALHHQAHDACYIANSVRSEITVRPRPVG